MAPYLRTFHSVAFTVDAAPMAKLILIGCFKINIALVKECVE